MEFKKQEEKKIEDVIKSCVTPEHFETARKYVENVRLKYPDDIHLYNRLSVFLNITEFKNELIEAN